MREKLAAAALLLASQPAFAAVSADDLWYGALVGGALDVDSSWSQLKLVETVGAHLDGGPTGLYGQLDIAESFGGGVVLFEIMPRAGYGFTLLDGTGDVDVVIAPNGGVGLIAGGGGAALALQPAVDFQVWLNDDFSVVARPLAFDIYAGRRVAVRADLLIGAIGRF